MAGFVAEHEPKYPKAARALATVSRCQIEAADAVETRNLDRADTIG